MFPLLFSSQVETGLTNSHHPFTKSFSDSNIPKISDEDKHILDQPLSKNEIFRTNSDMSFKKSPGLDGLPLEFYIFFWGGGG